MCGRYAFFDNKGLIKRFKLSQQSIDLSPRYNVAPGSIMPVVVQKTNPQLMTMKWGLVPSWAKDPRIGYKLINARAETIDSKPSFKISFQRRRCLIPTNGFYEWDKHQSPSVPYYIHQSANKLFSFAGLYDQWSDAEGKILNSFTIITTVANQKITPIHARMPVILNQPDESVWLNLDTSPTKLTQLLNPIPVDKIEIHPVSIKVNNPAFDNPELINFKR